MASACALVALALSSGARAQQAVGYQLNRYEPTPAGDPFRAVEYPWYSSTRWFAGGLTLDYANTLLGAQHRDANGALVRDPSPIAHQLVGHLDLAGSLFDRVALTLSVPLVLYEGGTPLGGLGPSGAAAGDPRLGLRARLVGAVDGKASLSAGLYVWIPIGAAARLTGDNGVRVMPRLTVGGLALEHLRWAVNVSFLYRPTARLSADLSPVGNSVGSEVQLAAGLQYVGLKRRLSIGPEAVLSIAVAGDLPPGQSLTTLELFGAAHYSIVDQVLLGLGVGAAVVGAPGPPDFRVLFSLAYAPVRARGPSSRFERVVVVPDEDGHVGAVEVSDGKRRTLLDKAYASTEIDKKSAALRPVQSAPAALPQVAALAQTLPPPDRDGDGIPDATDACPERAGVPSPDPIRHGCPPAREKIVILPDADGHVGGVEVDDGKQKTFVDKPYASVEVGADGAAQAVPPAPPKAVERTVAPVAAALPVPDADGDGVRDLDDACPDRPGVSSEDPLRNGCPKAAEKVVVLPDSDGHVGAVEVEAGGKKTLVDKAFASAEIGADGVAQAVAAAPASAVTRAIAVVAAALPMADGDGDGIRDEDDACPERAGVASKSPLHHGCPKAEERVVVLPDAHGHVGAVEVDDGKGGKVLLDAAYATAEVVGGRAQAASASPALAITRATAALGKALPPPDRDDDDIVDAVDACPDRKGLPSPSAARHGCPRRVEQVVVLADENGHVGAVEVDDGKGGKTLIDQDYGSAEVGTDGRAMKLAAEPSEVSQRFARAMAAQPPGARIILYFTARSEPARDLTGPIDNLVAEVKAKKGDFAIEVIGHTDQTGSETANRRIGLQRAQVIAERLIAAGVPKERVTATTKGSAEPAVKRKSRRVVELRNRRVEVWVR